MQKILDSVVDNKKIFGVILAIESKNERWVGSSGNLSTQSQYFIASTTKLYTTAIIFKLISQNKLHLDTPISNFLSQDIMCGLHIYKGIEYSHQLTIQHALAHTSGLPDYFQQKNRQGESLEDALLKGQDQQWSFEEAIALSKELTPHFPPAQKNKAYYSDTNFQLLGKIIEEVSNMSYKKALIHYILEPLQLQKTYLYNDCDDTRPAPMQYKSDTLNISKAMCSFGADGGVVSTAEESMIFVKAFFDGELFAKEYLGKMHEWNKIFFPLQYGLGIMSFKLPWFFSPFKPIPQLLGHSGLSGAFAYYCPKKDIYLTGTLNQIADPSLSYKFLIKILHKLI